MPLSNEFKAKIKAGNVKEALEMALAEAVELKVTTWVAQESNGSESEETGASPNQKLETRINLLNNEIATEIGEQFVDGGAYSQLKAFHQEQVNQSHRLIQNNINCLQRLLSLWGRLDPQIAASLPVLEESAIPQNQPLLIGDDEDEISSTPIVASSVAETPLISIPQSDRNEVQDSSSQINIPGVAAVAGIGIVGLNLVANQKEGDKAEVIEPELEIASDSEVSSPELTDFANTDRSLELVGDELHSSDEISNDMLDDRFSEASPLADPFADTTTATSSIESLTEAEIAPVESESSWDEVPAMESWEEVESAALSTEPSWETETPSQEVEIPTMESFGEVESAALSTEPSWEMETPSQEAEIPTMESWEEVESAALSTEPSWEMETPSQEAEIPTMESFGEVETAPLSTESSWETETPSQEVEIPTMESFGEVETAPLSIESSWEADTVEIPTSDDTPEEDPALAFAETNREDPFAAQIDGLEAIASQESDSWMESDLDLPSATRFFSENDVESESQVEEIDPFAPSPAANIDNLPIATENDVYGIDSIESFDDLAIPQVEVFAEAGEEEVEEVQAIAPPFAETEFEMPETASFQPESWESETLATPDLVSEESEPDFNVPGAAVLGGIGLAGFTLATNQTNVEEEAVAELPIDDVPVAFSEESVAEFPSSVSSLDEITFTEDAATPEASLASDFTDTDANLNFEESAGVSDNLGNWDLPQEAIAAAVDDAQTPDWALETLSQNPLETEVPAPEAELGAWDLADVPATDSQTPDWSLETEFPAPEAESPTSSSDIELGAWDLADVPATDSQTPDWSLETEFPAPEAELGAWDLADLSIPDENVEETISQVPTQAQSPTPEAELGELGSWDLADFPTTDADIPDWALETLSAAPAEPSGTLSPETELASWEMADLPDNTDWDAASLELGLNDEPVNLVQETNSATLFNPLEAENDLNTWEIESSLSSDTNLNRELDDLIGAQEIKDADLDLSTPEIWDNWTDEESMTDSMAALEELSTDTAPVDLASLDLNEDKWADPFADANLDNLNDWQLIKPETVEPAIGSVPEELDLFLNTPESGKFPTDSKSLNSLEDLSLDEDLSQWGNDDDPFADIFSMESSDTEKQK
jgi:hypothetical protein